MGKASGTLIVAQPLDSEQKSNYNLTVEATDGTRTVSTQVIEPRLKRLVVMVAFTFCEDGERGHQQRGTPRLVAPVCWELLML